MLSDSVPRATKLVLGKNIWTVDDLLSLPGISESENRPGVYFDVATSATKSAGYVGSGTTVPIQKNRSLGGLCGRLRRHRTITNGNGKRKFSSYHRHIRQP